MTGERELGRRLAGLDPALDPRPYLFAAVPGGSEGPLALAVFALVREEEGTTAVIDAEVAERAGLGGGPRFARITLRVHSDLAAVGLIAAVAGRLAAAGIAVNPLSGRLHDHLLVPWDERTRALGELLELASEARAAAGRR